MGNLKDASKTAYATRGENADREEIKLGCLQRIADATELMAKSHAQLESELKSARSSRDLNRQMYECEKNRNRALRGVITKLKKRLKEESDGG